MGNNLIHVLKAAINQRNLFTPKRNPKYWIFRVALLDDYGDRRSIAYIYFIILLRFMSCFFKRFI